MSTAWDPARDRECVALTMQDPSEIRCLPGPFAFTRGEQFSDASCSQRVGIPLAGPPCPAPELVLLQDEAVVSVFEAGPPVPSGDLHISTGGQCLPLSASVDFEAPLVGKEVERSSFGLVTVESHGDLRLQTRVLTSDGIPMRMTGDFYDTQRKTVCEPLELGDGSARCVDAPFEAAPTSWIYFSDEFCKKPLHMSYPNASSSAPPKVVLTAESSGCDVEVTAVYKLGAEHTGPVYSKQNGFCAEDTFAPVGATFYSPGSKIELSSFGVVTRFIE